MLSFSCRLWRLCDDITEESAQSAYNKHNDMHLVTMAYMGLVGWLISGLCGKECRDKCNM